MNWITRRLDAMRSLAVAVLVLALVAMPVLSLVAGPAWGATTNPAVGAAGYQNFTWHISGQYTANTTAVIKHLMPYPCTINYAQANARASGGTSPTLSVVLKNGASTVSTMALTAGTVSEGVLANTTVSDEATITVDFTIGGTSPTWNDITVMYGCIRQ